MSRSAVILFVLLAMLWQSLAMARVGSSVNVLADVQHAALHWHEESHQHDDDGTYQLDDSKESTQHVLGDHMNVSPALLRTEPAVFAPQGSTAPNGLHDEVVPAPTLDGLLRPPRHRA
jgi:hypothetical protein